MKIKSKFKDYYDYVAHIYGGGDPNIVYVRNNFERTEWGYFQVPFEKDIWSLPHHIIHIEYDLKWCIVAGKCYLLVSPLYQDEWSLYTQEHPISKHFTNSRVNYLGKFDQNLVELSRIVNAPVFAIRGTHRDWKNKKTYVEIDCNVPILSNLGFASIITPEQMYQDISYFLGNIMHVSPDMMPEPNPAMTDKERILSHGFDVKQSFRHRVPT